MSFELSVSEANLIECVLCSEDGNYNYKTSNLRPGALEALAEFGIRFVGYKDGFYGEPDFWSVFNIFERDMAAAAIAPFRIPKSKIQFSLRPIKGRSGRVPYFCAACGGTDIYWYSGENIFVPVTPLGIEPVSSEPHVAFGQCGCGQILCAYEFAFSSIPKPHDDPYFDLTWIEGSRRKSMVFEASSASIQSWHVSRMWFDSSINDQEEFTVDLHQIGPFKIDEDGFFLGDNTLTAWSNSSSNSLWDIGTDLFHNLAGEAMSQLKKAENNE
ncbi:hypothetical protein [Pseudomonas aeruginosa]|uniref:hypothetical protein n=1 Tax=Pseudomonas aeruginosa TaxID=287 RepID=UPI001179BCCA|nr:hypothetical protein [Pseudomonas aeruginosa]